MASSKDSEAKVPVQPVPETRGYEFGGPYVVSSTSIPRSCTNFLSLGAFVFVFGLSTLIYSFTLLCNDVSGCPPPSLLHPSTLSLATLKAEVGWPEEGLRAFFDIRVTLWVLSYYLLSLFLYVVLPGQVVEGTELACKGRLRYKFNGIRSH